MFSQVPVLLLHDKFFSCTHNSDCSNFVSTTLKCLLMHMDITNIDRILLGYYAVTTGRKIPKMWGGGFTAANWRVKQRKKNVFEHETLSKSVQRFSSCNKRTDRQTVRHFGRYTCWCIFTCEPASLIRLLNKLGVISTYILLCIVGLWQTTQAVYVKRNIEALSRDDCAVETQRHIMCFFHVIQ